jgi:uncharacterized membrane protein YdbT with pleckstrin-like domain
MDLHSGEQVIFEGHPSWRATLAFYFTGLLVVVVAAGIAAGVGAVGDGVNGTTVGLVAAAGFALVVLVGFLKRMATVYTITNQRLRIKRGIIARRVQQTRIDRVQNVNTNQRVIERILQVGTVDFDTAGTDDSEFRFVGVSQPEKVVAAVDRAQHEAAAAPAEPAPAEPASAERAQQEPPGAPDPGR